MGCASSRVLSLDPSDAPGPSPPSMTPLHVLANTPTSRFAMGKQIGKGAFGSVRVAKRRSDGLACALKCSAYDARAMHEAEMLAWLCNHTTSCDDKAETSKLLEVPNVDSGIQSEASSDCEDNTNPSSPIPDCGHPNIVKFFGAFRFKKQLFTELEHCSGGDLSTWVDGQESYDDKAVSHIFRGLLEAVAFCHSRQIAHRDIKLENVLLQPGTEQGSSPPRVVLCDFGNCAYFACEDEEFTQKVGSAQYMAPEVVVGSYSAPRADSWALGVSLYLMVSLGEYFWDGPTDDLVFHRIETQPFEFPTRLRASAPDACVSVIEQLLCANPAARLKPATALCSSWLEQMSWTAPSDAAANSEVGAAGEMEAAEDSPKGTTEAAAGKDTENPEHTKDTASTEDVSIDATNEAQ
eukprot:m.13659 g.13659  ORF g.13659 m.13659 type:complete len:408 (-) comp4617_c1_seq1:149-1372(-)